MACQHKFSNDLLLERIDFKPSTLIVGTFNPGWEHINNYAQWFYGRTRNNYFWDVLPRTYGETSLRDAPLTEWKIFCRQHKVALTDFIARIDDADSNDLTHISILKSYRDDLIARYFKCFTFVDLPNLLTKHPSISQVYLTRSINDQFWRQLWLPVLAHCEQHNIKSQSLLTPSGSARFQIPKNAKLPLNDFIFTQWQMKWHSV